jgi:hypothetical protein
MSQPTNEPLGDVGAGPSTTKDVDVEDSSRQDAKSREELQQPISSIATELRELVNRQDQLLLLLRKSLNIQDPLTQDDGELKPDRPHLYSDVHILDPEELEVNNRFAESFHVDITLDSVKLKEILEETVNLFLTEFQIEGLGCYSTKFELTTSEPVYSGRAGLTLGSHEKLILLLGGVGDNGSEVIKIQWGRFDQQGSGATAIEATKLAEVLQSRWRENVLVEKDDDDHNYEFEPLNYGDRYPRYLAINVYSQHSPMNIYD